MGTPTYSLEGNGTDLSKLYPSGGTNNYFATSAVTTTARANFMRVIPNSHFWTDLTQLVNSIEFGWLNAEIGKEYILIGLQNTINNGYKLKILNDFDADKLKELCNEIFYSIDDMIEYVRSAEYKENTLYLMLLKTLQMGFNLTNGLKMKRTDVYKLIDGERDYQDATWVARRTADGTPDEEKPVAEWINYIEYHLSKAKERVYHLDTEGALAEIRKVTALGVRTMEIHGAPERIIKLDTAPNTAGTKCCDGDCACNKTE
jgi:hypothetical protein